MNELYEQHFATPFYTTEKAEWVEKTNKLCQPHLDDAHQRYKETMEKKGTDFGHVYHSVSIEDDPKLKYLTDYIGASAFNLLNTWGVDLSNFTLLYESMWVQEFARDGGGHHRIHIHENSHITELGPYSRMLNYRPEPGHMYFFPSYLPHEYVLSEGGKFKFIHFNLQVISNRILNNEGGV